MSNFTVTVNVSRHYILAAAERTFKKDIFNPEAGGWRKIDTGGPAKEFMMLALNEIKDSTIF